MLEITVVVLPMTISATGRAIPINPQNIPQHILPATPDAFLSITPAASLVKSTTPSEGAFFAASAPKTLA